MQISSKIFGYFADNLRIRRKLSEKFADDPKILRFRLGFPQTGDAVAFLPLTAFLEQFNAFEAFQNVALGAQCAGALKTTMLSHKIGVFLELPVRGTGLVPQAWMIATGYSER